MKTFRCLNKEAHDSRHEYLDYQDAVMAWKNVRFWFVAIAVVSLLLMSACASARQSPNLPPIIIHMPDPDRTCRTIGTKAMHDTKVLGCADYTGRLSGGVVCTIIVGFNAAKWVIDHELRHCREGEFH